MTIEDDRLELQQKEIGLWRSWKQEPSQENLTELLSSLERLITKKVNEFKTAPVPPAAVRGMANVAALKAIQSYDPSKGTALGTHVFTHLRKVGDFVGRYQNLGRIPQHRIRKITEYKNARARLRDQYGREPTHAELLTLLLQTSEKPEEWTIHEVNRLSTELRQDLIASWEEPESVDRQDEDEIRAKEALKYIEEELDKDELLVYQYTLGVGGKPELPAGEIAKVMGISKPKVSRLRNSISAKLQRWGV